MVLWVVKLTTPNLVIKRDTQQQILCLQIHAHKMLEQNGNEAVHLILFDIQNAFHLVVLHDFLISDLFEMNLPHLIVRNYLKDNSLLNLITACKGSMQL
jgi:hypothetical protein